MQIKIIFCLCLIITLSFVSLTGCTPKNIIPDDTEQITGWGKPKQTPDTDLDSYEYISDNHQDYSFLPSLQTGKDRTVDGLDVRYFCLWGKYNTEIDSIRIRAIQMSIVVPHSTDNYITLEPGFYPLTSECGDLKPFSLLKFYSNHTGCFVSYDVITQAAPDDADAEKVTQEFIVPIYGELEVIEFQPNDNNYKYNPALGKYHFKLRLVSNDGLNFSVEFDTDRLLMAPEDFFTFKWCE